MVTTWLPGILPAHLPTQPSAHAGTAAGAIALLGWETLDRVLRSRQPLDVLTVRGGHLVAARQPESLAEARALMEFGVSVVVRASERHDPGLSALAASFANELPGEVHVQLYATPAQTNSYGWHYDFEEVFIAQTLGIKDYYFRDNTVARQTALGDDLDFTVFREETSQLYSARLTAGDALHLPARWWHLVKCVEDSLSISVGVMSPGALRTARRLPAGWTGVGA